LANWTYRYLRKKRLFVFFIRIIKWQDIGKNVIGIFFVIFVLFFLPRWSGLTAKNLGYQLFSGGLSDIKLVYQGPTVALEDICENSNCIGLYTKLFEGKEYFTYFR